MIDNPSWNLVREALGVPAEGEASLFDRARAAFAQIEAEVEKLVRDYNGQLAAERELRNALEADTAPGAQIQRRGG